MLGHNRYSSWWVNTPPSFTATSWYQVSLSSTNCWGKLLGLTLLFGSAVWQAWTRHFEINLIAAGGVMEPAWVFSGSGMFSAGKRLLSAHSLRWQRFICPPPLAQVHHWQRSSTQTPSRRTLCWSPMCPSLASQTPRHHLPHKELRAVGCGLGIWLPRCTSTTARCHSMLAAPLCRMMSGRSRRS